MKKPLSILLVTPHPKRVQGSYHIADIAAAIQERPLTPGIYDAVIKHDSWCRLLTERGSCNCSPDIEITCH